MARPIAAALIGGMLLVVAVSNIFFGFQLTQHKQAGVSISHMPASGMGMQVNDCLLQVAHVTNIKLFSQNDEDGALLQILRCMGGHGTKEYFEFGSENGMEVNTRILRDVYGWKGHLLDGGNENPDISLHKEFFSPSNIVSYIVREILVAGYTPRVLITEFNSNLGNELAVSVSHTRPLEKKDEGPNNGHYWKHDCYMGASAAALIMLAEVFGYTPVWSNSVNLFFVRLDAALQEGLLIPSIQNFPGPWPRRVHANCNGETWKLIDSNHTKQYAADSSIAYVEWPSGYSDIKLGFENFGEDSNYGVGWRKVFVI